MLREGRSLKHSVIESASVCWVSWVAGCWEGICLCRWGVGWRWGAMRRVLAVWIERRMTEVCGETLNEV